MFIDFCENVRKYNGVVWIWGEIFVFLDKLFLLVLFFGGEDLFGYRRIFLFC